VADQDDRPFLRVYNSLHRRDVVGERSERDLDSGDEITVSLENRNDRLQLLPSAKAPWTNTTVFCGACCAATAESTIRMKKSPNMFVSPLKRLAICQAYRRAFAM
jgi:hypothetical protein